MAGRPKFDFHTGLLCRLRAKEAQRRRSYLGSLHDDVLLVRLQGFRRPPPRGRASRTRRVREREARRCTGFARPPITLQVLLPRPVAPHLAHGHGELAVVRRSPKRLEQEALRARRALLAVDELHERVPELVDGVAVLREAGLDAFLLRCGTGERSRRWRRCGDKSKAPFPTPHQDEQVAEVLVQLPVLHEVLALVVEEEPVAPLLAPFFQFVRKFIISKQYLRDRVHDLVAREVGGRVFTVKYYYHSQVPTGATAAPLGVIAP